MDSQDYAAGGQVMSSIFVTSSGSGQTAYTVVPNPDEPVILQVDGRLCRVMEISAAGFTCPPENVKHSRRYRFSLGLPTVSRDIDGYVDILPMDESPQLRGQFVDLPIDDLDLLHFYALARQKEALRSIRATRSIWR